MGCLALALVLGRVSDTAKALAVSGNPPAITSATYNVVTGVLVITGVNLPKQLQAGTLAN